MTGPVIRQMRGMVSAGLCMVLILGGCGGKKEGANGKGEQRPVLSVQEVKPADAIVPSSYAAVLEGKVDVEIRPQVDGTLEKIHMDEGAFVRAGQPLFTIDDQLYRAQYNNAEAARHAAEARLEAARLDMQKLVPLVENNVVAPMQLQLAKANAEAAKASVEQSVSAAKAAKINLDYTRLKAPVSGYIGKIPFRVGSLVSKNQSAWLTLLSDVSEMYASFSMSELDYLRFRKEYAGEAGGSQVRKFPPVFLLMADGSRFSHQGQISTVSGQFDATTGSVRVRALFPNPDALLRAGSTGTVIMESLYPSVLQVPQSATVELQDKVFVFVVNKDNKVRKTFISVQARSGNNYVVSSGIRAGDRIVTAGVEKLQDGAQITPVLQRSAATSPADRR